ncbi:MAG: Ribosomal protein S5 [uncultured bacterium]|nr:MAG: Ribosomal protein S5 [uncultured bacterium]OGT16841.1 MAG: 30S ribosomal protein S5 [Gammaproteobacteria bacterium RIFCSPHIGHO2_02_FULL_38_33]OGT23913.1 MAG: 30S ribosomal protein S5 [Gammaproteobacteria bacterium RIFCSPHIGHO2_12_38_15]OGT67119.1 MAG: 30S ribosomal protein S5 [Gammaproteobacteria bacterium RIFCSPLOWO2_02_FULL_38_11]OGT76114.1 MAG: 30S ribosomal protein S5 [Gammaproteobacteria bacterium RIFCSPLOWO2_12_FULL_38_14]
MTGTGFDQNTKSDGLFEKLVSVKRNSKTVKGGRTFSFGVLVVVGDGAGRIGVGKGKAREVPPAIQKAMEDARRSMIRVQLNGKTLLHEMKGRHGATRVFMKPAAEGTGIIAGGAVRAIFEVLGVKNVLAKTIGSANPVNVLYATLDALKNMVSPEFIAEKRGKSLGEIFESQRTIISKPVSE